MAISAQEPAIQLLRRHAQMSYLHRKLATYGSWGPSLQLIDADASAEHVFRKFHARLQQWTREEDAAMEDRPPIAIMRAKRAQEDEARERFQMSSGKDRQWSPEHVSRIMGVLKQAQGSCTYPQGLEQTIAPRFDKNRSDVDGGSSIQFTENTLVAESQGFLDINLRDETKWWRIDEMDLAHGTIELRVDLPPAPCDGWYLWFTDVHLKSEVGFASGLEDGVCAVGWGVKEDVPILGANRPFDTSVLDPQVTFFDHASSSNVNSEGAETIVGGSTPFEKAFQVSNVHQVTAGQGITLRFYMRGVVTALDGRARLAISQGLYDSWAIQGGSGFVDSVRGIRYMTFSPRGFGV